MSDDWMPPDEEFVMAVCERISSSVDSTTTRPVCHEHTLIESVSPVFVVLGERRDREFDFCDSGEEVDRPARVLPERVIVEQEEKRRRGAKALKGEGEREPTGMSVLSSADESTIPQL